MSSILPGQQTTKSQHPIPQNVMDVEFKIVGDLTLRQFILVAVGAGLTFISYKLVRPVPLNWLSAIASAAIFGTISFVPLEDRGLDQWVIIFFGSIFKPTQRVWKKEPQPPTYLLSEYAQIVSSEIVSLAPVKSRTQLTNYLERLQADTSREDILEGREDTFLKKIILEEENLLKVSPLPIIPPKKTEEKPISKYEEISEEPIPEVKPPIEKKEDYKKQETITIPIAEKAQPEVIRVVKNTQPGRSIDMDSFKNIPGMGESLILPIRGETNVTTEPIPSKEALSTEGGENAALKTSFILKDLKDTILEARESIDSLREQAKGKGPAQSQPPTSGKKEEPLFKTEEFRKELVSSKLKQLTSQLSTLKDRQKSGEANLEKTIQYYQQQVKTLQDKVQSQEKRGAALEESTDRTILEQRVDSLRKQSAILQNQLETIQKSIKIAREAAMQSNNVEQLKQVELQEKSLDTLVSSKKDYEVQIDNLIQRIKLDTKRETSDSAAIVTKPAQPGAKSEIPSITSSVIPNVIYGTIRDKDGHLLENAVIIIKDKKNEPIRALKTNKLGQFKTNTPLSNGEYTIFATKSGLTFTPFKIDLKGAIIDEIELLAQ